MMTSHVRSAHILRLSTLTACLLVLALAGTGCGDKDADGGNAGTPDGGNADGGTPDAATPDAATPDAATPDAATPDAATPDAATPDAATPGLSLTVTLAEFLSGTAIEGATVVLGDQTETADATGSVTFSVTADQELDIFATNAGYRDTSLHRYQGSVEQRTSYSIPSDATLGTLSTLLNLPLDPNKGIVAVAVLDFDPDESGGASAAVAGATIDLDVAYDVALVLDSSQATGLSPGNTTLAGSSSNVIFINVVAGSVSPTITPPAGFTCATGREGFTVNANGYNIASYNCSN